MSPAAGMLGSPSPLRMNTAPASDSAEGDAGEDAGDGADGSGAEVPDLSGMTKAQLLATATALGVEGVSSRNNKAEIIAAIEAAG